MSFFLSDPRYKQSILDIFTQAGFAIVEGGVFNPNNPNEFGLLLGHSFQNPEDIEKTVSKTVGVNVPSYFRPEEIINTSTPILAKGKNSARGKDKWLLETTEQKIKFLTLFLLAEKMQSPSMWMKELDHIFEDVKKGNFEAEWVGQILQRLGGGRMIDNYKYQEYKPSLSPYNTSIRVWVDALGKVHGGALIRSKKKKGEDYMADDDANKLDVHFDKKSNRTIGLFEVYFTNPRSPFYLHARDITSNSRRNGRIICLNGESSSNRIDASVLQAHGIDPLHPVLPNQIQEFGSSIGKIMREAYPIVGVDFLLSDDTYYLETNIKPGFVAKAVGLPKDLNEHQQLLEMIKRVAFSAN